MKNRNNIKEMRLKKEMSVSELARKVEVSERYIYFIEVGDKKPSLDTAKKIAKALETPIENIF